MTVSEQLFFGQMFHFGEGCFGNFLGFGRLQAVEFEFPFEKGIIQLITQQSSWREYFA